MKVRIGLKNGGEIEGEVLHGVLHGKVDFSSDMEFVKIFTPPEFQAKTFIPSISANFNSFGDKNTKK